MAKTLTVDYAVAAASETGPSDSARRPIVVGCLILAVFFGGLGTWAATAPLNGAIVGNAVIKVEGNRKSVQHPDGGIVTSIKVHEGDHVSQGDVLLTLNDTDTRAQVDVLSEQVVLLRAMQARLQAELAGSAAIAFPPEMTGNPGDPSVRSAIDGQTREFQNRATALDGQKSVLEQRIAEFRAAISGDVARRAAYQDQLDSIVAERLSIAPLLEKGLMTRDRTLQLDRTEAGIHGQIEDATAEIERNQQAIGENEQQIAQLAKDRAAQAAADLSETRAKLLDAMPRLQRAQAGLDRATVRAPYSGIVVGLSVFSVGGVVARGERLLDIVPEGTPLVVEAQIGVEDIADLRPGMIAEVHFTSYKQRTTPLIHGRVAEVSADRLTDERTGAAYYTAKIMVDPKDLAATPEIQLYPGMAATVMIITEARTALDYLIGPLATSFNQAFRQK